MKATIQSPQVHDQDKIRGVAPLKIVNSKFGHGKAVTSANSSGSELYAVSTFTKVNRFLK